MGSMGRLRLRGCLRHACLGFALAVLLPTTAVAAGPQSLPQFGRTATWHGGTEGSEVRAGIATDAGGDVYVVDFYGRKVQKYDPSGRLLLQWGGSGSGNGQFIYPGGIAVDAAGNVYVLDLVNGRIQKFDPGGSYLTQWPIFPGDSLGSGYGIGRGIAVSGDGNVYVTYTNGAIARFGPTGANGQQLRSGGGGNVEDSPNIAADAGGNLYVTNSETDQVQKYDAAGNLLLEWGTGGKSRLERPAGIATDPAGNVYVSEELGFKEFDSSGKLLTAVETRRGGGNIAVDRAGNVYLSRGVRFEVYAPLAKLSYAKTVLIEPVSGKVLVKEPGKPRYTTLTGADVVPLGTAIDVGKGRVALTSAKTRSGDTQSAEFYYGAFKVGQTKAGKPLTQLRLIGFDPKQCAGARTASASSKHVKGLWGDGKGNFQTIGHNGSATVRGTNWFTEDRCAGTVFKVKRGVVAVRDFSRRLNVTLRAGQSYLAPAR